MNYFDLNHLGNKMPELSTIKDFVEYCKAQYAERIAIIQSNKTYTYQDLIEKIYGCMHCLADNNIKQGEHVGIVAHDSMEYIAATLAVMYYGATAVALPAQLPKEAIVGCSMQFQLKAILYTQEQEEKINFLHNCGLQVYTKNIIDINANNITPYYYSTKTEDPCIIMFTTGTEGQPKGAILSHQNIIAGTRNGLLGFGPFGYNEDNQTYQLTIPLTHSFGFIRNLMCCLQTGSKIIISESNLSIFSDMQKYNPTRLVTVPGFCNLVLTMMKQYGKGFVGQKLEYIVIGGASYNTNLIQGILSFGIQIYGGYGMTETTNLITGNPEQNIYTDSIGYLYPNQQIKIVDNELWVKGDNVFLGYYGVNNAKVFDSDGYFPTGDLVRLDNNTGFMYFIGRKKDLIVLTSGINISPNMVETVIYSNIPEVIECLVYTNPDESELYCELFSQTSIDKQSLTKINQILAKYNIYITDFIFRNTPFNKDNKMSILRSRKI